MKRVFSLAAFVVAVGMVLQFTPLCSSSALAHSLYIQGTRYHVSEGKASPFFFCYGHHIPVDDAIRRKKLNVVQVHQPDGNAYDVVLRDEKSLHSYLVKYEAPGTYAITAETTPGYFTKWLDKKGRVRHSIKPMSKVMDKASEIVSSTRSSQWTKTYVVCEQPSKEFPAVLGLPLEIAPSVDLSTIKMGDAITFDVYNNGKRYTGEGYWDATFVGYSTQAEDFFIQRTHVKGGSFQLPVSHTGRWFVRYFIKTDAPEKDREKYLKEKRTSTLVFEVPNPRRKPKVDGH